MGLDSKDFFWQKVDKKEDNECWSWIGAIHYMWGYGQFRVKGKYVAAHRFSWMLHNGEIPNGLCVCYKCDNPKSVNPKHLFLGTVADNNLDKKLKGRQPSIAGEKNPRAKLTENDIRNIRSFHKLGYSGAELGRIYGVVKEEMYDIFSGKRWSCVK